MNKLLSVLLHSLLCSLLPLGDRPGIRRVCRRGFRLAAWVAVGFTLAMTPVVIDAGPMAGSLADVVTAAIVLAATLLLALAHWLTEPPAATEADGDRWLDSLLITTMMLAPVAVLWKIATPTEFVVCTLLWNLYLFVLWCLPTPAERAEARWVTERRAAAQRARLDAGKRDAGAEVGALVPWDGMR